MLVRLTEADMASAKAARLQSQVALMLRNAGQPGDAAMFAAHDARQDNHIFYFSPRAVRICSQLLLAWDAKECQPPRPESVAVLIGNESALELLSR
jgi:hypothetical protein